MSIFTPKYNIQFFFFIVILLVLFFSGTKSVFASASNGTIDSIYKYAWGEDMGWINFGCDEGCDVEVTDNNISGYVWSSNFGWINLNPSNGGVKNTDEGVLSGYAWSSNLGWINFDGVTIGTDGRFLGYATVKSTNSRISFSCKNGDSCDDANFGVKTDWQYAKFRQRSGSIIVRPTLPVVFFHQLLSLQILPPSLM